MKAKDAQAGKAMVFRDKGQQQGRNRPQMRWIQEEVAGTNDQILRVGGFENQQATWLQYPQSLHDKHIQLLEGNMLCNVKTRNNTLSLIVQRRQIGNAVSLLNRQPTLNTGLQHSLVKINAMCVDAGILQQFKPFTSTTTDIQGQGGFIDLTQRLDEGQVYVKSFAYQVTRTTMTLLECTIKPGRTHF